MSASLRELKCVPCRGDARRLTDNEAALLQSQVTEWKIISVDGISRLERVFRFNNFIQAMGFTNQVGELAEAEGHHPALLTEWGRVTVTWWTHAIQGLHQNDFIMAAKTDALYHP